MGKFLEDLAKDLEAYANNVARFTAQAVADELTKTTYDAIAYFYVSWTPEYYTRHVDNLLFHSYKRFTHNNRNRTFSGGVELSSEFMEDIYNGSPSLIFDIVYKGYHGLDTFSDIRPAQPWAITTPSPAQIILAKRDDIYKKPGEYISQGIKKANKQKYLVL